MNTILANAPATTQASSSLDLSHVRLGIVCPMANELDSCRPFVAQILQACDAFHFQCVTLFAVLDHVSRDGTLQALQDLAPREPRLRIVWAPENRCVVDAYVRGYREALDAGSDWILEIDAGFSHDPADAPRFFETMAAGYDCVFGTRFSLGGGFRNAPLKRRMVSRYGSLLTNKLIGTQLTDMTSGYELFSRRALEMVLAKGIRSRAHFFQTEIKVFCRNLKLAEVPIVYSNPSPSLSNNALLEALRGLSYLFRQRLKGTL